MSKPVICRECPWRRASMPGYVGKLTAEQWIEVAASERPIMCHLRQKTQCAGAAVFRRNVCKIPRDPKLLVLPADKEKVFATAPEFINHHNRE